MTFMLATIYSYQYKLLSKTLAERDERRLSDSDIETLSQRHQEISKLVSDTDDFLMFHNAGTFCFQLFDAIMHLYDLIFFRDTSDDPVLVIMRVFFIFSGLVGLTVTTAGGIMLNHYVSTNSVFCQCHH